MSSALLFLVPIGMLAVVWTICFVGCVFPTSGEQGPYSNYILQETTLVGYWPLSDLAGEPLPASFPALPQTSTSLGAAGDLSGMGHVGSYTIPPAYPMGSTIPQIVKPTAMSGLKLRQTSMLPGDAFVTGSKNFPACVDFEGGYVNIPWAPNSPMLTDFTLEAWVLPKWSPSTTGFNWVVFAGQTTGTGFAIYLNTSNQWEFTIGDGNQLVVVSTGVPALVNNDGSFILMYVAVRWNSAMNELTLWVNPDSDSDSPNPPPPTPTWPTPNNPSPPITYVPVNPSPANPVTFFIGAGASQLPLRMQDGDASGSPLFPFQGQIQSVALYQSPLDASDIGSHFSDGTASDT